jgi:serine/threonine protein kinase
MKVVVDEDGDILDPTAQDDFEKECAVLVRLNHPNLLRMHAWGACDNGGGFIVTELMPLGSLRAVLSDASRELPWAERTSIALQLAIGMEHLHGIPIMHRDFKVEHHSDYHRVICLLTRVQCVNAHVYSCRASLGHALRSTLLPLPSPCSSLPPFTPFLVQQSHVSSAECVP